MDSAIVKAEDFSSNTIDKEIGIGHETIYSNKDKGGMKGAKNKWRKPNTHTTLKSINKNTKRQYKFKIGEIHKSYKTKRFNTSTNCWWLFVPECTISPLVSNHVLKWNNIDVVIFNETYVLKMLNLSSSNHVMTKSTGNI